MSRLVFEDNVRSDNDAVGSSMTLIVAGIAGFCERVRFIYYAPQLSLRVPFCVLFQHTFGLRRSVPADMSYR